MFTSWVLAELASKWLIYVAMLAVPGGFLVFLLAGRHRLDVGTRKTLLSRYLIPACLLGIVAVSLFFLIQIGNINQRGVAGMLDREMGALLASTALGDGLQWRLNGFGLALVAGGLMWITLSLRSSSSRSSAYLRSNDGRPQRKAVIIATVAAMLASLAFGISFTVLGHVANLALPGRIAIVLHLLAISVWGGALLPLLMLLSRALSATAALPPGAAPDDSTPQGEGASLEAEEASPSSGSLSSPSSGPSSSAPSSSERAGTVLLLKEYGQLGWCFLAVLVLSGLFLIWQLLASPGDLFNTSYGRLMLLKLSLVSALMLLGALNKYRLVPKLENSESHAAWRALRQSIRVETVLVFLVLVMTALFTTVVGPL